MENALFNYLEKKKGQFHSQMTYLEAQFENSNSNESQAKLKGGKKKGNHLLIPFHLLVLTE